MAKLWKKMCEKLWGNLCEKCGENCEKVVLGKKAVKKWGVFAGFTRDLHEVLHGCFISVRTVVFHDFHIAYYYNYK